MDDCGQLTIRCSQDYFSLDCGITAFELSDYSPGDEPEARVAEPDGEEPSQDLEQTQASNLEPEAEESGERLSNHKLHNSLPELTEPADSTNHNYSPSILPTMQCGVPIHSESAKRPLQGVSHSTEVSPTQPSLPKRAALFSDGGTGLDDSRGGPGKVSLVSGLQHQAELSRSTPSLMDPPDRSKFWLELDSVYPENVSQSYESLQVRPFFTFMKRRKASFSPRCVFNLFLSSLTSGHERTQPPEKPRELQTPAGERKETADRPEELVWGQTDHPGPPASPGAAVSG